MLSDKENHSRKSQFPGRWQAAAFRDEDRFERDAFDAVGSEVHLRPQLDPRPSLLQLSCAPQHTPALVPLHARLSQVRDGLVPRLPVLRSAKNAWCRDTIGGVRQTFAPSTAGLGPPSCHLRWGIASPRARAGF